MSKPEGERIATLEANMTEINKKLDKIDGDIEEIKQFMNTIVSYESRLTKLEAQSNIWKWLSPALSSILAAVVTFLVIEYFKKG